MGDLFNFNKICKKNSGKILAPILVILVIFIIIGIGSTPVETENGAQISGDKNIVIEEYVQSGDENKEIEDIIVTDKINNETQETNSDDEIISNEVEEKVPENVENEKQEILEKDFSTIKTEELTKIPNYSSSPYYVINNNVPFFYDTDLTTTSYEKYGDLDSLRKMYCNSCLYRKRYNANF